MLKFLPIIPSRISQKIFLSFFFILVCYLLFPNYASIIIAGHLAYNDLTALLEYLNVLLEYIDLLLDFQLTHSHHSFSCASHIIFLAARLFILAT